MKIKKAQIKGRTLGSVIVRAEVGPRMGVGRLLCSKAPSAAWS